MRGSASAQAANASATTPRSTEAVRTPRDAARPKQNAAARR
jgi:hypothetical protein